MNKHKHTPGPWWYQDTLDNKGLRVRAVDPKDNRRFAVCFVWGEDNQSDITEMSRANAALIAAAPDLLLAAKRLVAAMDDYDGDVPASIDSPYARMQDAIAKAEGNA